MTSPIAISVRTVDSIAATDPRILSHPAVLLEPVAHPDAVAALDGAGATRRGTTTWSYQTHDGSGRDAVPTDHAPLVALAEQFRSQIFGAGTLVTDGGSARRLYRTYAHQGISSVLDALGDAPNLRLVNRAMDRRRRFPTNPTDSDASGVFAVSRDRRTIWIRLHTHHLGHTAEEANVGVPLDLRPAGRNPRAARPVTGVEALDAIAWLDRNRRGALALLRSMRTEAHRLLADDDMVRALARVLPDADQIAGTLEVDPCDVVDALDRTVDVAAKLATTARRGVTVVAAPGRPARSLAYVGADLPSGVHQVVAAHTTSTDRPAHVGFDEVEVDAAVAAALTDLDLAYAHIDPAVADVAAMAVAPPHDDPRLFDYQNVMVGRFLATSRGMANLSATGAGKTPTTLVGFQAAARTAPGYRALVVAEAVARFQWRAHAEEWAPEFRVVVIDSRDKLDQLRDVMDTAADDPVLVITSYALAADVADVVVAEDDVAAAAAAETAARAALAESQHRAGADPDTTARLRDELADAERTLADAQDALPVPAEDFGAAMRAIHWHDVAVDEVVGLRGSSKTGRALWALRDRARRGLVLTATPINRSVDDLAKLLAWAFGDRRAFHGARPSVRYDLADVDGASDLLDDLGPTIFRVDKSEIDVELPELAVEVVPLRLRRAELALAEAARTQLKEKFGELMANLELASERAEELAAAGDASAQQALADARRALGEAKGAWLGSTTLARQAAADPVAIAGSQTAGAELLRINGLVDRATEQVGTKRRWAVEYIDAAVDADMQVVLFTEFSTVARALISDLRDRDLAVGEVLGGGGARRDADILAYRDGDLDVLVCTSAGERGLNLQTRNGAGQVLIHFDLPWTASGVVQRTGRVERIGGADFVQVVFPVASGTIEDRVAGLVCARATASLQALDVPRGIDVNDTDFGRALGRLALDVDVTALRGGERALLEMTRALLAEDTTDDARPAVATTGTQMQMPVAA